VTSQHLVSIQMVLLSCLAAACGSAESRTGGASHQRELASTQRAAECAPLQVPIVSGASTLINRSGVFSSDYEAWQAFDADDSTMWISEVWQTPAWIDYEWGDGPKRVDRYALTFVNGSLTTRAPKDFTLEGWDGSAWAIVDARTDETNWAGRERREYSVAAPNFYQKYRLNVSDDNDERAGVVVASLGKVELLGTDCGEGGRTDGTVLLADPDKLDLGSLPARASFDNSFVITTTSATHFRVSAIPAEATLHCTDARCLSACNNPQAECKIGGSDFWLTPGDQLPFSLRGTAPVAEGPFSRELRFNYDYTGGTWTLIVPVQGTTSQGGTPEGEPVCAVRRLGVGRGGAGWISIFALLGVALRDRRRRRLSSMSTSEARTFLVGDSV
jgi:hypothetical protein